MKRATTGRKTCPKRRRPPPEESCSSSASSSSSAWGSEPEKGGQSASKDSSDLVESDLPASSSAEGVSSNEAVESNENDVHGQPPPSITIYTESNPPTGQLRWFWRQRKKLFSRYEQGVWMTDDAWFEVTPEPIARRIAIKMLRGSRDSVVIDTFCGVGGNAIQLALRPECRKVYGIDNNADALACAKHNARIYEVSHKIEFIHGDFFELSRSKLRRLGAHSIFISPPWGGTTYRDQVIFDLERMNPYTITRVMDSAQALSKNIALYIPRTSDLAQIAQFIPDGESVEAIHYCLLRKSKALTVYFGSFLDA